MDVENQNNIQTVANKSQSLTSDEAVCESASLKSSEVIVKRQFNASTARTFLGAVVGAGSGLLGNAAGVTSSLEIIGLNNALAVAIIFAILGAVVAANAGLFRKNRKITISAPEETVNFEKNSQNHISKEVITVKGHHQINTLVYVGSPSDFASETFNQDKVLTNARQILVMMDHTTSSMH